MRALSLIVYLKPIRSTTMQINITTSKANKEVVSELTKKLPTNPRENVIARIALGYSLSTGKKFVPQDFNKYDSQGKEYKETVLFEADMRDYYVALICQHYGISKNDDYIPKYVKLHIDDGLERLDYLFKSNPQYTFLDFLIEYLGKGIDAIEDAPVSLDAVKNNNLHLDKTEFGGPIEIKIGYNPMTKEEVKFCLNGPLYNNQHIAVAGKSGSGKTELAKEFLRQLVVKTQGQVNFLFLDFKGISVEDQEKMKDFFEVTQTKCINAPSEPFPLNPLTFIDTINEKNRSVGINKFVDIIAKYSNIGKVQQQTLKDATKEAFIQSNGQVPSLKQISDIVFEKMGDKRDSLTELFDRLSNDYELFSNTEKDPGKFLNKNYYLSLSGDLDNTVRFTSVFLIINYIFNIFTNLGSSNVVDGYRSMRYVLVIDEAHELFREKKSLEILEVLLRKIRSYGVSVFLLSQGIAEYNQGNFDFSQECETAFLLPINDMANTKVTNKFLGLSDKEGEKAKRNLESLKNGQAISNIKEYTKTAVFDVVQYWKEK